MSNKRSIEEHGIPENKYNKHAWIIGDVSIGERTWIGAFTLLDGTHSRLVVGKGCNVASGAQIITHSTIRRCISEGRINKIDASPVEIGDYCFIGTNAAILKGAKIGHHSVIGAGCVVSEDMEIPPYSIVVGVPGKIVGSSKKYLGDGN